MQEDCRYHLFDRQAAPRSTGCQVQEESVWLPKLRSLGLRIDGVWQCVQKGADVSIHQAALLESMTHMTGNPPLPSLNLQKYIQSRS